MPDGEVPRVGLVLGAGGVVGQAYQAGVLATLAHDVGWDPRTADVIVGTSAGAVSGALLRLGVSAHDLAAWAIEAPLSVASRPLQDALADDRVFPPLGWRDLTRPWRGPTRRLAASTVRRPWRFRVAVAAATLLPPGQIELADRLAPLDDLGAGRWPDGLVICTARRDDGRRVAFGTARVGPVPLGQAVAASCAIPGYFQPVNIDGVELFDGGVHSGTNADVLRGEDLDLVIVVAPMSVAHGRALTADALVRRSAHRRLEREVASLRARGVSVVRFEPTGSVLRAMGLNLMADDRAARVVQAAFFASGRHAASARVAPRLASLGPRTSGRGDPVSALGPNRPAGTVSPQVA